MTEVYRIGVNIAMASNGSALLGVLGRDLLGVNTKVGELEKGFSRLKLAIGGALAIAGGVALIAGVVKLAEAGEKLSRVQASMAAAGISNLDVARATTAAWITASKVMGTQVEDNLDAINHIRATFGSVNAGIALNQTYMKNAVAIGAITGKPGEPQAYSLARTIHLSGAANDAAGNITQEGFAREMKLYTAMIASGGGKLGASDIFAFQKNAGSYAGNLSDEGRINLAGFLQSQGGVRAGTQLAMANRALKDGVLQKGTLALLESMGLIDPNKIKMLKGAHAGGASPGGNFQMLPGALKNENQFRSDFMGWIWNTLSPTLAAHGIVGADAQVNWLQHAKLTTNVTRALSEGIRNQSVDRTEAGNVRKALGVDQYGQIASKDFGTNMAALHDAFHNLIVAIASPLTKAAIPVLQTLTKAINGLTAFARVHPAAIVAVAKSILILGVALIALGTVAVIIAAGAAILAAGPVGVVVAGIAMIVAAIGAFVALNWNLVVGIFNTIKNVIGGFFQWLLHGDGKIKPGGYGAALTAAMSGTPVTPPSGRGSVTKTGDVYLDGKKVGKIMSQAQDRAANMPSGSYAGFDGSRHMPLVGVPAG